MGFKTWHNYGYGICVSDIVDVPVERLVLLLEHAPVFHQEVNDWLAEQGIENLRSRTTWRMMRTTCLVCLPSSLV